MSKKKKDTNTCAFKWCLHGGCGEKLHSHDGKKYHDDCFRASQDYDTIRDLWSKHFKKEKDTYAKLAMTYKRLLLEKGHDSDFILFCVRYGITNKILHYPLGLFYLVEDSKIKAAYVKKQCNERAREIRKLQEELGREKMINEESVEFEYKPKNKNFLDIFGGK